MISTKPRLVQLDIACPYTQSLPPDAHGTSVPKKATILVRPWTHITASNLSKVTTKSQVISDTPEFRHAYRTIPSPSPEDKIIHGLHVMSGTLKDAPPPTSISQMEAIANLRDLFESWCSLGPPLTAHGHVLAPGRPRVAIELPRVSTPSSPSVAATPAPALMPPPQGVVHA